MRRELLRGATCEAVSISATKVGDSIHASQAVMPNRLRQTKECTVTDWVCMPSHMQSANVAVPHANSCIPSWLGFLQYQHGIIVGQPLGSVMYNSGT
jgi:hypothetical protein